MSIETTDWLVAHVTGARHTDLDAAAREKARTFLLDTLGVAIAGSAGAHLEALRGVVAGWGGGAEATVWGSGERLPAGSAALLNAYQIHCLEYDCVHEGAVVHPMATLLAALLAHAERRSAAGRPVSGADLLLALAVGVDIAAVLGVAATGPIRWFRPATAGGMGAAAALARLEGLDDTGVKNALGAMYAQTSGTLQPHAEGSPMLGLQIGFNARGALAALDLARAGLRGPHDVLDGPYGYLPLLESGAFDLDRVRGWLGRQWQITRLAHKPFPSGRLTHGVIDALGRLMAREGFAPADIVRVEGRVPPLVYRLVGRPDIPHPEPNYAKLCLRFVAGAFLARGAVDVPAFRGRAVLDDPDVHAFAARVDLTQDDNPDPNALDPQHFAVTLASGARHEILLARVWGHPDAPLTAAENEAKFRRCAGWGAWPLPAGRADAIVAAVSGIEAMPDAAAIVRLMVP
jgi:2-methylcitrate dehydratase PrpD